MIKLLYLNGENAAEAVRNYWRNQKLRLGPCSVKTVRDLVKQIEETGCSCYRLQSGRPSVPVEVVAEVHNTIIADPLLTAGPLRTGRIVACSLEVPKTIVLKILRIFPYRFQCVQILQPGDEQQHLDFMNYFLIRCDEDSRWPLRILWTDEAHFSLTVTINSKSCVTWAEENPHNVVPKPLHEAKVSVAASQAHSFSVRTSSNRSLPQISKRAPSQLLEIQQCCRIM